MQIIKNKDKQIHKNDGATIEEFYMSNKTIDTCIVHISGRYPKAGKVINSNFSCVCYVLEGNGKVCGENITKGDAFNILKNESYYFEGNFSMVMSGTPAFDLAQSKVIFDN